MSTVTVTPSITDPFASLNAGASGAAPVTANDTAAADRFLTLLVAQMENQDPLNPMDNAQITSQMAQINTVSGIQTLNTTVQALNSQFLQMQALQGASLVGRDVTVAGDRMTVSDGVGVGGFELAGPADRVKVEVLDGSGRVAATLQLGAQTTGRHGFEWAAAGVPDGAVHTFRVIANAGTAQVSTAPLMRDRVEAVSLKGDTLTLELARSGAVAWPAVKAFN